MRPRALFDYDTVLACWRLLADAANDLKLDDSAAVEKGTREAWLEEATEKLLLLTDQLRYDDIVGDGQLTGPAMLIAQLEGWCVCGRAQAGGVDYVDLAIQRDDDSDLTAPGAFRSDREAVAFVRARAATNEPGTKLHQIALALVKSDQRHAQRQMGKVFHVLDTSSMAPGWYYQIDMGNPVGPFASKTEATRAAQEQS